MRQRSTVSLLCRISMDNLKYREYTYKSMSSNDDVKVCVSKSVIKLLKSMTYRGVQRSTMM